MKRLSPNWKPGDKDVEYCIATHLEFKKYIELPHEPELETFRQELIDKYDGYSAFDQKKSFVIRNHYYCADDANGTADITLHPIITGLHPDNKMAFYKRVLCVTLQKAVENNLAAPVTDQLSLLEELALTREIACEPLAEYSSITSQIEKIQQILETCDNEEHKTQLLNTLDCAKKVKENNASRVVAALQIVKEFCDKAAKIDSLSRDKFSIHTLNSVVAQITHIIAHKLHDNNLDHLAVEVEEAIKTQLVMPLPETSSNGNGGNIGTNLTPDIIDDDVRMMDQMVPLSEDRFENEELNQEDSE